MDTIPKVLIEEDAGGEHRCSDNFPLHSLREGQKDKLGHRVQDILWCGSDYIVYRSEKGIYVQFSDNPDKEKEQRKAFTEIAPELCELRFLTGQITNQSRLRFHGQKRSEDSLFSHNIAQSLMLTMEGKCEESKKLVKATLEMAVRRTTSDNTIRYLLSCFIAASVLSILIIVALAIVSLQESNKTFLLGCLFACLFGVLGALFSIIVRAQSFEMKPCQQSTMNYWMSAIRIIIGMIGGGMLFVCAGNTAVGVILLNGKLVEQISTGEWKIAAIIGFLGGFSERLVESLFKRSSEVMAKSAGTPVQQARNDASLT